MKSENSFLQSSIKQLEYYKMLGEKTFTQCSDKDLLWKPKETSNSIAIIVNHLWGNMLSRWTNFKSEDGEKTWRNRDKEFEEIIQSRQELLKKWDEAWQVVLSSIQSLESSELEQLIYIRNQGHTITEAIQRQLAHYSYHIGQIVYLGTLAKEKEWLSLSIPKGQSKTYNESMFNDPKAKAHFTDKEKDRLNKIK